MGLFQRLKTFNPLSELAPGIPKPTTTLVHMLVAEMLANLDVTCTIRYDDTNVMEFPSFRFKVSCRGYFSNNPPEKAAKLSDYFLRDFSLKSEIKGVLLDDSDQKILLAGWVKWYTLKKRHDDIKQTEENQQKAVDAIAALFKTKEVPEVKMPTHIPDCSVLKVGFGGPNTGDGDGD